MVLELLVDFGFSLNEAKVYLALLKLGPSPVSAITKKCGVFRSNIYDALDMLIERGMVSSVVRENKKFYEAAYPTHLREILKAKEDDLEEKLPELVEIADYVKEKQEVHFFRGEAGIRTVLRDINTAETYDAFGISSNLGKVVPHFFPIWVRQRIDKKLFARMIKTKGDRLLTPEIFGMKVYKKIFEVRDISKEFYTPAATFIYGNKVAVILESKVNPIGIIIENKEIADGYRKQFEALWKIADPEDLSWYSSTSS
jgi:sugar-specific transcriptional regulator TrmB